MLPYFGDKWGNPSSAHVAGLEAKVAVDIARRRVADLIRCEPNDVVFTSSATEATNTALRSALLRRPRKRKIIAGATEHSAVISFGHVASTLDLELVVVSVKPSGVIDLDALARAIDTETAAIAVMWANNETGVLNPVHEIAALCRQRGVLFHCDAVQAAGKIPVDLRALEADYVTLSSHKINGPKGAGALIARTNAPFTPLIWGGHQESGRRGGTENVPAIVGFGKAAALAAIGFEERNASVAAQRDYLEHKILAEIPGTYVNGAGAPRLPNTANIGFSGVDSEMIVNGLDRYRICVSSGSACLSDSLVPSHVVLAMTGSYRQAKEAVRFSLCHGITQSELDRVVEILIMIVASERSIATAQGQ